MYRRLFRTGPPALLFAALLLAPAAAAQEDPAKLDPVAKELETVRKMLANAQAKFSRGVAGVEGRVEGEAVTPGRACCSGNLESIDAGLQAIRKIVRERGVCFERKREVENVEIVHLINQDLRSLGTAVDLFADSPNPSDAQRALDGCTRAYLNLRRSLQVLPECAAAAGP